MSIVTDAVGFYRSYGVLPALRRVRQDYLHGKRRYYLTWDDFVAPSTFPLEAGDLRFRLFRAEDTPKLAAFSHLARARLETWCGPGYVFALALKGEEAIGYYSLAATASRRVRPAVQLGPDELFAVEIFTVPAWRRRGVTRHFRIAVARLLREQGFRGTWGLHDPLNYLAVDAADRLPALTTRTGTLTRRCRLGRVRFSFDPATPLSPARVETPLRLLTEVLGPGPHRIAILLSPGSVILSPGAVEDTTSASSPAKVDLRIVPVRESEHQGQAFSAASEHLTRDRPDGLIVLHDPMFVQHRRTILRLAAGLRVPVVYEGTAFARAGGLMACAASAGVVPPAIRGATVPGTGGERLVVNLKAARQLDLVVSSSLLRQAHTVIA